MPTAPILINISFRSSDTLYYERRLATALNEGGNLTAHHRRFLQYFFKDLHTIKL